MPTLSAPRPIDIKPVYPLVPNTFVRSDAAPFDVVDVVALVVDVVVAVVIVELVLRVEVPDFVTVVLMLEKGGETVGRVMCDCVPDEVEVSGDVMVVVPVSVFVGNEIE